MVLGGIKYPRQIGGKKNNSYLLMGGMFSNYLVNLKDMGRVLNKKWSSR